MATSSLFSRDWETCAGSGHSLAPAGGCGADSLALLLVPGLGFNGALLAAPIADVVPSLLSPARYCGVPTLEKQGWLS